MDSDIGASVYSEAKSEYTKQLIIYISTPFHRFFMECLKHAGEEEQNPRKVLSHFQDILSQIPEWNVDKVERETTKIINDSRCDYLEDLLTAVFIAHTKILTAIRIGSKNKKVQITVPKLNHFIHRGLTECGRLLWASIYLFQSDISGIEKQKNHRQIEGLIQDGIQHAIRGLLPVKSILKDYLQEGGEDEEEEKEEEEEEKPIEPVIEPVVEKVVEKIAEPIIEEKPVEPVVEPGVVSVVEKIVETVVENKDEKTVQEPVVEKVVKSNKTVEVIKENTIEEVPIATPVSPTIVLDTVPSVEFADMIHTFKPNGDSNDMNFQPSNDQYTNDDTIKIYDDDAGEISDVEDLDDVKEDLGSNDFETL